jgi:hypothetical protein
MEAYGEYLGMSVADLVNSMKSRQPPEDVVVGVFELEARSDAWQETVLKTCSDGIATVQ